MRSIDQIAPHALGKVSGPVDRVEPWLNRNLPTHDGFKLDPWAHVRAGHVVVPNVVGMQPEIWTPYDHQIELVDEWVDLDYLRETGNAGAPVLRFRNVHEEKSRQMGITWAIAWVLLWALMYHRVALLAVHEHLAELDDGGNAATIDSLFGRMLYMAKGELDVGESVWPLTMQPTRHLQWRTHPSIIRNVLRPGTHLTAEGAGPDPARGRKYAGIFLDEAARIPWSEAVNASTRAACPDGRLYNSTPYGTGNTYGRIAVDRPANFRYLRHHWSVHPLYSVGLHIAGAKRSCQGCKGVRAGLRWDAEHPEQAHRYPGKLTSPWYDRAVIDLTDEQVAQELEIDYSGALTGRVYPEFDMEIHVVPEIPYDPTLPIITCWDYGVLATAVGIFQETATELRQIGEVELGSNVGAGPTPAIPDTVVPALIDTLADLGVPFVELEPQFTRHWLGVGDPAGDAKTPISGEQLTAAYAKLGFTIQSKRRSIDETIRATKRMLQGRPKRYLISAATCPRTIDHWRENRWPTGKDGQISANATEPKNDKHNHMLRAVAYLAAWLFPAPSVEEALHEASTGVAGTGDLDALMADERDSVAGGELNYDMGF